MTIDADYAAFLTEKSPADAPSGLTEVPDLFAIVPTLKGFQAAMTAWALRRGRAAIFAGTGLGKTLMQLLWARSVVDHLISQDSPPYRVLILCPLAVAEQTVAEARKFGIDGVAYALDEGDITSRIVVTNYERFEKFDISAISGIVLDESGIIKAHDGKTRQMLTEACRSVPWRLCCSATPAPNDYTELGQHAEFLGVMDAKEMLAMFFVHDRSIRAGDATQGHDGWRLKAHAKQDFWRWLASWSVMVRHPRDLGFDEPGHDLPPLNMHQITVAAEYKPTAGELFPMQASTLAQRIGVRRDTAEERAIQAVKIVDRDHDPSKPPLCQNNQTTKPEKSGKPISGNTIYETQTNSNEQLRNSGIDTTHGTEKSGRTTQNIERPVKSIVESEAINEALPRKNDMPRMQNIENTSMNTVGIIDLEESTILPLSNGTRYSPIKVGDVQSAVLHQRIESVDHLPLITATKPSLFGDFYVPHATQGLETLKITETGLQEPSNILTNSTAKWIIWCQLNKEQDRIAKLLGERCFSIDGSLPNDEKISRMQRWLAGERPVLISKPKIFGYGMNLQCCWRMIFVGATDSFEQTYQAVRRCWRFGQTRPVEVYFIASELEGAVVANLKRKELAFETMLDAMSDHMRDLQRENVLGGRNATFVAPANKRMELPAWIM